MSLLGRIRNRVRAGATRARLERDMQREMDEHLARAAERFRARGLSDADALLAARREFGNVGVLQEQARDARGARWIDSAMGDLRYAARQIRRTPLLAVTIVLTLTLAIGAGGAAIGTISGVFMRPAPGTPDDRALVAIRGIQTYQGTRAGRDVSYPELMDYAALPAFAEVAGFAAAQVAVDVPGRDPAGAQMYFVTPNFFRALRLPVEGGPGFAATRVDEHSAPELSAVIGRRYAGELFGSAEASLGKIVHVNGIDVRIVGLAPPRFIGVTGTGGPRALWMPVSAWSTVDHQASNAFTDRQRAAFFAIARLREGASGADATPAVQLVASRSGAAAQLVDRAVTERHWSADVVPLRGNMQVKSSRADDVVTVAMIVAAVVLILLVCTTTVSSLLVGASVTRRHEIAVRLALGASRGRIVRQLLTESVLLSAIAAGLGLVAFAAISRGMHDSITDLNFDPSWTTALLTAGLAMAAAMLCGLSPALHATREGVGAVLKDSGKTATARTRLQRVFVVAQIALTQPLLLGLAATIAIVMRDRGHAMSASVNDRVVRARFEIYSSAARAENKLAAVRQRMAALPGVIAVLPKESGIHELMVELPATAARVKMRTEHVPPGYFGAMDVHLVRGREFVALDSTLRVAPIIIGNDFAAQAFGNVDPVGKRMTTFTTKGARLGEVEVVGVASSADVGASEFGAGIRVFTPNGGALSAGFGADGILIRTAGPAEPMIPTLREIAREEAPLEPIGDIQTLAQIEAYSRSEIVQAATAATIGGSIALFLASIGLYAVVALGVGQRRREIGVRISLGARPSQVVAMFFRGGLRVSLLGLGIGLPLSAGVVALAGAEMGLPRANLPAIAAAVASAVIGVAALATWIPARRAARVEPVEALK